MSAVNIAEVYGKLLGRGISSGEAWEAVLAPIPEIIDFDMEQAKIAGDLLPQTRALGLSLGDRACLALGVALKAPIYTAGPGIEGLEAEGFDSRYPLDSDNAFL